MKKQLFEVLDIAKNYFVKKYEEQEATYQAKVAEQTKKQALENFRNADIAVRADFADALNESSLRNLTRRDFDSFSLKNFYDGNTKIQAILSCDFDMTPAQKRRLIQEINMILQNMLTVTIQAFEEEIASDCNEYHHIVYQNQFYAVPISKNDSAFYNSYCNFFQAYRRRLLLISVEDIICEGNYITLFYRVDMTSLNFYAPMNYWNLMKYNIKHYQKILKGFAMIKVKKINPEMELNVSATQRYHIEETPVSIKATAALTEYNRGGIIKLDSDHYKVKRTGQIKKFKKTENRIENISSISQSINRLRSLINMNVTDIDKVTWLTLTYKENMNDEKRLYDDFRKFNMRLKYHCKKNSLPSYEYICTVEYQARGALHCHVLLIWDAPAPFISNEAMASLWTHGFTKTTALKGNIENIGTYLTAYLTDLPLDAAMKAKTDLSKHDTKKVNGKRFVKAARLSLYPSNTKLYRCSKGIKKPKDYFLSKYEFDRMINERNGYLTFENILCIYDDSSTYGFFVKKEFYDISTQGQEKQRFVISYRKSKFYRELYDEYLQFCHDFSERVESGFSPYENCVDPEF